jgi:hypothetical protein
VPWRLPWKTKRKTRKRFRRTAPQADVHEDQQSFEDLLESSIPYPRLHLAQQ